MLCASSQEKDDYEMFLISKYCKKRRKEEMTGKMKKCFKMKLPSLLLLATLVTLITLPGRIKIK